jgi:hypothetical protein
MELGEWDGVQNLARVWMVQEVAVGHGAAIEGKWLEPDGLKYGFVNDQKVGVKLVSSSTAILGRPGAGA